MKISSALLIAAAWFAFGVGVTHAVEQRSLSVTKTIPETATLEYRVKGVLLQSYTIAPGIYRISVEQLH